jgi:hypothetical protein
MSECPALFSSVCELTQYFPSFTRQEIASFLFGVLVVVVFSIDHYKVPTYAKTTIGEFIELAPESLTSHSRYMKGLGIYIALMLGFYAVLLTIGPTALSPILSFLSGKSDGGMDSTVWPLAATSIITLIGSGNDKYLGRLEGWLRSIAHEAAYIPSAVTNLSSALDGSFPLTEDELRAAGELTPETRTLIQESQEGSRQNWIRAKFLYSRLEQLRDRDDQFRQLMKQPENERAFNFVTDQRDALTTEVNRDDRDETVIRKIDAFKNALAVFLASILWRGSDTESAVRAKLSGLKLNVNTPGPQSLATFMFHLCVFLGGTALVFKFALQIRKMQFHDASVNLQWHLTLAFLVSLLTAFFVTRWREKQLAAGEWKYKSDAVLRCAVLCTIAIGVVASLITFAWHQGGTGVFYAMLMVGFGMAFPSALLFQLLMRWAASSPPTDEAVAARVAYDAKPSALFKMAVYAGALYAIIAFIAVLGPFYWLSEYVIVAVTPQQIVETANDSIRNIRAAYGTANSDDKWFTDFASQAAIRSLENKLKDAKLDLSLNNFRAGTMPSILAACDALGNLGSGKHLFKPGCELGDDLRDIEPKGGVHPNIYALQGQISALKPQFEAFQNYDLMTDMKSDWRNALVASLIWAVMAAVFAISVLLYRRQVLWEGLTLKKLPDFVPEKQQEREAWLRQPLFDIGKLSPLEALRYPAFRARLADHMNVQAAQPEGPRLQIVA